MNTVPKSLDTTPSLRELAKEAERMARQAHRRTLIVTLSIGAAAILTMSVWMLALIFSVEKGREQARNRSNDPSSSGRPNKRVTCEWEPLGRISEEIVGYDREHSGQLG